MRADELVMRIIASLAFGIRIFRIIFIITKIKNKENKSSIKTFLKILPGFLGDRNGKIKNCTLALS